MINVEKVSKYFGLLQALNNVTFTLEKGEIVGFLGKNGSGKTTLMRTLTTYLQPDSGKVTIGGKNIAQFPFYARERIGYLPENPPLYFNMDVYGYLKLAARLKGVPPKQEKAQIDKVLGECQLQDVKRKTIGVLSKGYKQRLGIAQALLNEPEILILDEPTNGLDPEQIQHIRRLIKNVEHSRTVILSTHILSEIELIAKRIIILDQGKVVANDLLPHLLVDGNASRKRFKVTAKGYWGALEQALKEIPGTQLLDVFSEDSIYTFVLEGPVSLETQNVVEKILKAQASVIGIEQVSLSLENIFLKLVSHA